MKQEISLDINCEVWADIEGDTSFDSVQWFLVFDDETSNRKGVVFLPEEFKGILRKQLQEAYNDKINEIMIKDFHDDKHLTYDDRRPDETL